MAKVKPWKAHGGRTARFLEDGGHHVREHKTPVVCVAGPRSYLVTATLITAAAKKKGQVRYRLTPSSFTIRMAIEKITLHEAARPLQTVERSPPDRGQLQVTDRPRGGERFS